MKHLGNPVFLLFFSFVLALGAGIRERISLLSAYEEMSSLRDDISRVMLHKKVLLHSLNSVELGSPFLEAEAEAGSDLDELVIQEPSDVVLYLLSTQCPHSPKNYGFLNSLADAGVPVVGLATDSIASAIVSHRSEHEVRFPILFDPQGSALEVVPGYATPALVVVAGQEVVFVEFGELQVEDQERLRALTSRGGWPSG